MKKSLLIIMVSSLTLLAWVNIAKSARPYWPNSFLCIKLKPINGVLTEETESKVNVAIHYAEPDKKSFDYSYDTLVLGNFARIHIPLPSKSQAIVTAKGPTGQQAKETLTISDEQFQRGLENPVQGCFMSTTFTVPIASVAEEESKNPIVPILVLVLTLGVIGGGFWYWQNQKNKIQKS